MSYLSSLSIASKTNPFTFDIPAVKHAKNPGATNYEVTDESMKEVALEDTEHYSITKSFLNSPAHICGF
ncbi:hypothetical protein RQM65_11180 [Pricia sp. S334]|uniref:Uncharacterized protein n=1 Tax=Pricia mediterranea TaxID=3076079 RepID=A0ABU3L6E6_9FLAO|nr:hypothetical protein [Pricia sp. S334]MDT7829230.1 hypothetical protein [Pricia sp. S334]